MLIIILMFIFSKFLSVIYFWIDLVPKFKFSRFTEISYRVTLLHAYYDFSVYFFKIFVADIILGKFCPKI